MNIAIIAKDVAMVECAKVYQVPVGQALYVSAPNVEAPIYEVIVRACGFN